MFFDHCLRAVGVVIIHTYAHKREVSFVAWEVTVSLRAYDVVVCQLSPGWQSPLEVFLQHRWRVRTERCTRRISIQHSE